VLDFLCSSSGASAVETQATFSWCWHKKALPFDVAVRREGKVVIVEVDGIQHFEDMAYWGTTADKLVQRDTFKAFCALQNGVSVIRICQEDVYKGKWPTWQTQLSTAVTKALESDKPTTAYLSIEPSLYDRHKEALAAALERGTASYAGAEGATGDDE
jgi:hypothetical protein